MDSSTFITSLTFVAGVFFGLLNNVLTSKGNFSQKWQYVLYVLGSVLFVLGLFALSKDYETYKAVGWACIITSVVYTLGVYYLLNIFVGLIHASKLVPRVINFTENAKSDEIRLWGGDLNFFGASVIEMEANEQYKQLKNKKFDKILILCKKPKNNELKKCYGKIINDFKDAVEFKFYNEETSPDLNIRGRIKRKYSPDIFVAFIYERIDSNRYKAIEEDMTKQDCNMIYVKIWEMSWKHADYLSEIDKKNFLKLFSKA